MGRRLAVLKQPLAGVGVDAEIGGGDAGGVHEDGATVDALLVQAVAVPVGGDCLQAVDREDSGSCY